jgi:hypothetical protein
VQRDGVRGGREATNLFRLIAQMWLFLCELICMTVRALSSIYKLFFRAERLLIYLLHLAKCSSREELFSLGRRLPAFIIILLSIV